MQLGEPSKISGNPTRRNVAKEAGRLGPILEDMRRRPRPILRTPAGRDPGQCSGPEKPPVPTARQTDHLGPDELDEAIHGLKNNKAAGPDGIPVELSKLFPGMHEADI